ncbi:MAG: leucine-rich repeat domain-containing protein [Mycoplasmataceae bacterium]|nr:leucine-rich repeat domain-containing protein [Mycoplasmataceae bacterium]
MKRIIYKLILFLFSSFVVLSTSILLSSCFNRRYDPIDIIKASAKNIGATNGSFFFQILNENRDVKIVSVNSNFKAVDFNFNGGKFSNNGYNYTIVEIGDGAFRGANLSGALTIPDTVTIIGDSAFGSLLNADHHDNLILSKNLTTIGPAAFINDQFKGQLVLPKGLKTIKERCFKNNCFRKDLFIPNSITEIGNNVFEKSGYYNDVEFEEDGIHSIPKGCFKNCFFYGTITFPDCITLIDDLAFQYVTSTHLIPFPKHLISIGRYAFGSTTCTDFASEFHSYDLILPDTVNSIAEHAFCNSTLFNGEIHLPDNAGFQYIAPSAFEKCYKLKGTLTIPQHVKTISNLSFSECSSLDKIEGLENVDAIGDHAFYSCVNLDCDLSFGSSLNKISSHAFNNCTGIKSVNFKNNDQLKPLFIGENSFDGCTSLTTINDIPEYIDTISKEAFKDCTNLETIKFNGVPKTIDENTFQRCTHIKSIFINSNKYFSCPNNTFDTRTLPNINLYVIKENIDHYRQHNPWKNMHVVEL